MTMRFLLPTAILAVAAAQQNADPIGIIDSKLYIDGGKIYYGGSVDNGSVAQQSEYATRLHENVANEARHPITLGRCLGHQE
jgi:hypothetical protein